jgi:hypothetical protein
MYCPSCGKSTSVEQKFCRACGLSLEKIAQSLTEQLPSTQLNEDLEDRKRKVERWLTLLLGSSFGIFVISVLGALIYKIIIIKGDFLLGFALLALFIALMAALILVVYRESLREAVAKRQLSQATLPQPEATGKLLTESHFQPVPSVTEPTTELLVERKRQ